MEERAQAITEEKVQIDTLQGYASRWEIDVKERYRINAPMVIRQSFEDEVVIVNLESGSYYSLDRSAAEVWELLEAGCSSDRMEKILRRRHPGQDEAIAEALDPFVSELLREEILVVDGNGDGPGDEDPSDPSMKELPCEEAFRAPSMTKYTDMQDLLLLDPVHEVAEGGWPRAAGSDDGESSAK